MLYKHMHFVVAPIDKVQPQALANVLALKNKEKLRSDQLPSLQNIYIHRKSELKRQILPLQNFHYRLDTYIHTGDAFGS